MDSFNKLALVFLLLYSSFSYSSAQLQVDFKATNFQQLLKTNTGLLASVKYSARNNAGRAVYGLRTASLSKAIVGNVLKKRAFSPWGAAIVTAITAASYFFDSQTGAVYTSNGDAGQYSTSIGRCEYLGDNILIDVTFQTCLNEVLSRSTVYDRTTTNAAGWFLFKQASGSNIGGWQIKNGQPLSTNVADYSITAPDQASDSEIYDSVVPTFGDSELAGYLNDPFTGLPDKDLTPLTDAAQDLTDDYDAENDGDPLTTADSDGQYDNGEETFTEDPTELPSEDLEQAEENEQTDQCQLTPDALGCQEFGSELTSVEIPTEELSFSFNPISLASNTSCPAPSTLNLTFGTIQMSNQPLCDFLAGINTIVIAVCTILAVYILTGGVKNG